MTPLMFPPPHCIAVYLPSFELGLRFPLHPFVREDLDILNIYVPELYPNVWGCLVAFLILYKVLAVPPTLTAFRYIFRARLCNSQLGRKPMNVQLKIGYPLILSWRMRISSPHSESV